MPEKHRRDKMKGVTSVTRLDFETTRSITANNSVLVTQRF